MLLARTLNFGLFNAEVEVEVFFFICFKWSKGISVWITTRIVFNLVRKMYFLKFWKQLTFFAWSADKSFLLIFKFKPCANFDCFAKKQRLSSNFRFDSPHNCTITNMVLMIARYENNDFSGPLIRSMWTNSKQIKVLLLPRNLLICTNLLPTPSNLHVPCKYYNLSL